MIEEWRFIPEFITYVQVSSFGNVRTVDHIRDSVSRSGRKIKYFEPGKAISACPLNNGYLYVAFQVNKKRTKYLVHRLIARAFVPGYKEGHTVNHKDGNKLNNFTCNLEWITKAENTHLQWKDGLVDLRGENHPSHKLKNSDVKQIKELVHKGINKKTIASLYRISQKYIYDIMSEKRRKHG